MGGEQEGSARGQRSPDLHPQGQHPDEPQPQALSTQDPAPAADGLAGCLRRRESVSPWT